MQLINDEKKYIFQTYRRFRIILVKGRGKYVWDDSGKRYLDFFSGISVCNIGHCHPKVVEAIRRQAGELLHVSNHYYTVPQILLAGELVRRSFPGQVFFSNSGAEANECAIKLVRKWAKMKAEAPSKKEPPYEIIVFKNSFHGRTMATLTATGQEKLHKGFEPLLPGFVYADYNNIESVRKLLSHRTAAIMIEPVLGEGGVLPADKVFLKGLKKICSENNLLLVFDEVQTGIGRTGKFFAYEHYGVKPDIVTLGKGLAGGLPLGATIAKKELSDVFGYGDHGSTFGGNLLPCAAALEVLKLITPGLLADVEENGKIFNKGLEGLKSRYPHFVKGIRSLGFMFGMDLDFPGRDIVEFCQEKGLLINATQNTTLRFLPPLIINKKDISEVLTILEESFKWLSSRR